MRTDQQIVTDLNRCIDLHALSQLTTPEEWDRLGELVRTGKLVWSGDQTGFHIDLGDGSVEDCGVDRI